MKQKKYILKIIVVSLIFGVSFIFGLSRSPALASAPADIFLLPGNTTVAQIDTSVENKIKVCHDVACANETPGTVDFPTPGFIDFDVSGTPPLAIDSGKGISGKVWGDELGWVTFNPPYGGVFFADPTNGLLKGTAWSETSGVINFSATGQEVVIDPVTGEWNGWAWASGPYGGWIKFDCKNNTSCVHSTWRGEPKVELKNTEIIPPRVGIFHMPDIWGNLFENLKKINNSAFVTSTSNLKNLFSQIGDITVDTSDFLISSFSNFFTKFFERTPTQITQSFPVIKKTSPPKEIPKKEVSFSPAPIKVVPISIKKGPSFFSQTISHMSDMWGKTGQAISNAFNFVGQTFGNAYHSIISFFENLGISFSKQVSKINGSAFTISLYNLENLSYQIGQGIINTSNFISSSCADFFGKTGQAIGDAGKAFEQGISVAISGSENLLGKTGQTIGDAGKAVGQMIDNTGNTFAQAIKTGSNTIAESFAKVNIFLAQNINKIKINDSAFATSASNLKFLFNQTGKTASVVFNSFFTSFVNIYHETGQLASSTYQSLSFSFKNLEASALAGVKNLLK